MASRCLALTIFILTSWPGAVYAQQYVLRGGKVTLTPDLAVKPEDILWKLNGNKVVEFNGKMEDVYRTFKDRITLDWHTADLKITELRYEDSGRYEMEAFIKGKELQRLHYELQVIDKVTKPNISCEINDGSSSNNGPVSGSLLCSAEPRPPQSPLTYVWTSHGKVVPGRRLSISLGDEYDDDVYICNVSNPLSSETASFTAKDCYPAKSLSPALIAVLVIIPIAVILSVGLGITYCKIKRKACFAEDLEKHPATDRPKMRTDKSIDLHRASTRPSNQPLCYQEQNRPLLEEDTADEEIQTHGDNQQGTNKAISEDENESDNEGDVKEKENLSSAASQPPQSPTPTYRNSKTSPEPPITARLEPDQDPDTGDPGSDSQSEEGEDAKALGVSVRPDTPPPTQLQRRLTTTQPQNTETEDAVDEQEREKQRGEDNQQGTSKAGSEDENGSDNEGDDKEMKNERNLYLATSEQPDPESDKPVQVQERVGFFEAMAQLNMENAENKRLADGQHFLPHDGKPEQGSDSQRQEDEDEDATTTEVATVSHDTLPPTQPRSLLTTTQPHNSEPEDTADEQEKEKERCEDNQQGTSTDGPEDENEPDNVGGAKEMESQGEPGEDEKPAASPETPDAAPPDPPLIEASTPSVSPKGSDDGHQESDSDQDTVQPSVPEPKVESENVNAGKTEIAGESEERHYNGTAPAGEGRGESGGLPVHNQIQHEPKELDGSDCSETNQW